MKKRNRNQKRNPKLLKLIGRLSFFFFLFLTTIESACAQKVSLTTGFYYIQVQGPNGSASIGNFSINRLGYSLELSDHLETALGVSFLTSGFYSGDLGFGLDISARYFPFTSNWNQTWSDERGGATIEPILRPYFGVVVQERKLQSSDSGIVPDFLGFGILLGTEYSLGQNTALKFETRYHFLVGPYSSAGSELDLGLGFAWHW